MAGSSRSTLSTTVDNTGAEAIVTDGPFAESKEWIGGFWILELPDLDAALAVGDRGVEGLRGQGRGPPLPARAPAA